MTKTLILPGMGADSAMYPVEHYQHLRNVTYVDWPAYKDERTIRELSLRVIDEYGIASDMIVGGSSLGGMVAVEIAKILGVRTVILIGSATTPDKVNPVLKMFGRLSSIAPFDFLQLLAGRVNIAGDNDVVNMFQRSDTRFIKAMCKAIFRWDGIGKYRCAIRHIHGRLDTVIYPPDNGAEIITQGGHLISMTHGKEVAAFIERVINS